MRSAELVAYRAASEVAGKAAFFVLTILAARRLSREGFGVFAIGTTAGWIAVVASDFGLQMHLARTIARAPGQALEVLRRWMPVRVWSGIAAWLLVAAACSVANPGIALAVAVFALGYVAAGLIEFLHHFYRGLSRTDVESTLTLWHRLGALALGGAALWVRPDPLVLAAAMLVAPAATAVYSWRLAPRIAPDGAGTAGRAGTPGAAAGRAGARVGRSSEWMFSVAPIGAGVLLSALYFRIDIFLLEAWQGTQTVALYNAVFRLIEALRLFPAAILAVALPVLVRSTTAVSVLRIAAGLTAMGVAFAVAVWSSAGWLVPLLYGSVYAGAVPALRILAWSFPLMALNYALTYQLLAWDGHRAFAALCLAALAFNLTLNARLIPALSLDGAAWTTLATEALLTVGCGGTLILMARAKGRAAADSAPAMAVV